MRVPAARINPKPRRVAPRMFPAPTRGWIANENLANPTPGGAAMLENWFPTATGARLRWGTVKYATVGDGLKAVVSAFSYLTGTTKKLFATTDTDIYDITTVADPNVSPTTASGSHSSGDWSVVQFATTGGVFLRLVNGVETPLVFDGTTFSTAPAITGATPANLNFVWSYKNRLFFIEKNTLDAWYLPVDSVGGAAVKLPLGASFGKGGSLLFGATWSSDSGAAGGLSEQCIFVSTEGEIVVFQGTDPANAATWTRVGVYQIGRPLGREAFVRAGSDIIIATDIGFVSVAQATQKDIAALSPAAVSYPIETAWNERVALRSSAPWQVVIWPTKQMSVIALPTVAGQRAEMLIANAITGAWALYTGWDGTCLTVFQERMFFGSQNGKIIEAEVSGADQGAPYVATCVPLFDDFGSSATPKVASMARAVMLSPYALKERLSAQFDYAINLPSPPDAASLGTLSVWGSGVWGTSIWGDAAAKKPLQNWRSVSGSGYAMAPALQITSGSVPPPAVDLVRIEVLEDGGDVGS